MKAFKTKMVFHNIFSKKPLENESPVKIIVDKRERNSKLIPAILNQGFQIEFKQLLVGDYVINNTVIERKTINDLKSSIINKRILRQLEELKQFSSRLLVIEGLEENTLYESWLHENATRGFLLSSVLEHQIPLIFTQNAEDTARYFKVLARKKDSGNLALKQSRIFRTVEQQVQYVIEGFPYVGPKKAERLIKEFGSLKRIINASLEELQGVLGKRARDFKYLVEKDIKKFS